MNRDIQRSVPEGANSHRPYYPALDGMRAVAVLLVFGAHYLNVTSGWIGVNLFFVLSGFLITGILFDGQHKAHRFRDFYVRRSLRIFPLYYAIFLALLLATPLLHIQWKPVNLLWPLYLGNWIGVLKFLHPAMNYSLGIISYPLSAKPGFLLYLNSGHFWSLCIEEQFYLVWPFLVFSIRKRVRLLRTCILGALAVFLLRFAAYAVLPQPLLASGAAYNLIFFHLDEFLVGGALALLFRGRSVQRFRDLGPWIFGAAFLILAAVRLYPRLFSHGAPNQLGRIQFVFCFGITLADALAIGMILMCSHQGNWFARLLGWAPLRALGKISYGFYVFHDIPHNYYDHFLGHWNIFSVPATAALAFAGTLALSITSYFLLEVPFLRLKTRFE